MKQTSGQRPVSKTKMALAFGAGGNSFVSFVVFFGFLLTTFLPPGATMSNMYYEHVGNLACQPEWVEVAEFSGQLTAR